MITILVAGGSTQNPKVPLFHPCLVLGDVGGALVFVGNGWERELFQGVTNKQWRNIIKDMETS